MREFKSKDFWRAVLAELVGMTLFIFLSLSAAIGNGNNTHPDQEVKVSLAFGLAIATLAQSLGHISGAHLNPAVTLGMLASCQISVFKAIMYIVAQMLGSALASGIVYGTRPSANDRLGLNTVSKTFNTAAYRAFYNMLFKCGIFMKCYAQQRGTTLYLKSLVCLKLTSVKIETYVIYVPNWHCFVVLYTFCHCLILNSDET